MKKFLLLAMVTFYVLAMTGCNTMEGMGQDVQKAGEKLEESAKKHKE
jgi:predicted small secreted protein